MSIAAGRPGCGPPLRFIVERALEIISEASRALPAQLKQSRPEIPWRQIADFGNILRHAYFSVDPEVVWEIATQHVIPLKSALQAMRDDL